MIYDVVIIGSGLGGLACGNMLAKEGQKVCILEKNRQFGGSLQIFSREKTIFDTGVHYLGGLGKGQNLHQFFKYFGIIDDLSLKPLDKNGFDRIIFKGDPMEYPHAVGYHNFVERLAEYFPQEKKNIQFYIKKIREICDTFPLYNLQPHSESFLEETAGSFNTSLEEFINSITSNKKLRAVLLGNAPLYAGEADRTPLYLHALIVNSYISGSWKCKEGGGQIAREMVKQIKAMGGDLFNYAEVSGFQYSGSEISSVELTDGRKISGKLFISNIHPASTVALAGEGRFRRPYAKRMASLENTISTFMLNVVLKPGSFKDQNYNIYYYKDNQVLLGQDKYFKDWPHHFALFPGMGQKGYLQNLSIMVYMDYSEVAKWSSTFRTLPKNESSRGEDYEVFKVEKAEKLIDLVEARFPGFRSCVQSYYTSTPLTYRDYIGSREGSLYGVSRDYKDPMKTLINSKTRIPNLYLTGQNVHIHGILGVTIGAILTVGEILGEDYILNKIKNA